MDFAEIFKYPEDGPSACAERIVLAAIFDKEELLSFGVSDKSEDLNEYYLGQDEFSKWRKLWLDPEYLSNFYYDNIEYFRDNFWHGINEETFVTDAIRSAPYIYKDLENALNKNNLEDLFQPLAREDEQHACYTSIRVKSKFGTIFHHYAFRIYAVKVDDGCYIITGGAIKIDKDMGKAPNTQIELKKLNYVYDALAENDLTDKISFLEFVF